MNYRRGIVPGGIFFLTLVTHQRRPILITRLGRQCLRAALRAVRALRPFSLDAVALLPDHLHMLMRLPDDDGKLSVRVGGIKRRFTHLYLGRGGVAGMRTAGQRAKRYAGVWQGRFWEHTIRDAPDFKVHLDYVHANPLKHGLVKDVRDWRWSSFHRYVKLGEYDESWAGHVRWPHAVEYQWAD